MAGSTEDSEVKSPREPKPFLEVICIKSRKIRRFSIGTEAGFAISVINKKLVESSGGDANCWVVSHIEAVKEDEEPVNFGPNSLLVDYGPGWRLQTVTESLGDKGGDRFVKTEFCRTSANNRNNVPQPVKRVQSPITSAYIGKIALACLLIFVFGAAFTLLLENLPQLILRINSSL